MLTEGLVLPSSSRQSLLSSLWGQEPNHPGALTPEVKPPELWEFISLWQTKLSFSSFILIVRSFFLLQYQTDSSEIIAEQYIYCIWRVWHLCASPCKYRISSSMPFTIFVDFFSLYRPWTHFVRFISKHLGFLGTNMTSNTFSISNSNSSYLMWKKDKWRLQINLMSGSFAQCFDSTRICSSNLSNLLHRCAGFADPALAGTHES